jgi:hypothetical protein
MIRVLDRETPEEPTIQSGCWSRKPTDARTYNSDMPLAPLSADTSPDIEQLQVEGWRRMSPAEKAAIVSGLTQASYDLALAGVRHRFPDASAREQFLRLAIITLGRELATRVYPEIAPLGSA